jgi:L-aspartate oxidase
VLGSGIAALRAAIALAGRGRVLVLTKAASDDSNTGWAQGGIAAALGHDDSPALHLADTLAAGDGLCEADAVKVLVEEGVDYVRELLSWGAGFDRDDAGAPALAREAAHSVRRVLHARDATGREIGRILLERAAALPSVEIIDHARVTSLRVDSGQCIGATWMDRGGLAHDVTASATLLATGGAGQVFAETTNPDVTTGDGIAMAYEAGADVADLEFVQFHPTVLDVDGFPRFLLSEALRGEGARLLNADGERFMARYEPAAELAPRDRVARAIVREQERTGRPVYLSLAHLPADLILSHFPVIAATCRQAGLDLTRDPLPVSPAVHYVMGGVVTDLDGRTAVPGLFAAGEVACTGVHGANRLASNSLLEGLVFGARAGVAMAATPEARREWSSGRLRRCVPVRPAPGVRASSPAAQHESIPALAWRCLGLVREAARLEEALARTSSALERLPDAPPASLAAAESRSLLTVAHLMAVAALRREESRGGHYRSDFPARDDDQWQIHCADVRADA